MKGLISSLGGECINWCLRRGPVLLSQGTVLTPEHRLIVYSGHADAASTGKRDLAQTIGKRHNCSVGLKYFICNYRPEKFFKLIPTVCVDWDSGPASLAGLKGDDGLFGWVAKSIRRHIY